MSATGPEDDDELLVEPGRLPAWAIVVVAVAVVAALAVFLVGQQSHSRTSSSPRSVVPSVPVPTTLSGLPLDGTDEPVVDATLVDGQLIVLRTDSLLAVSSSGHVQLKRALKGDDNLGGEAPAVRLFVGGGVGWAVSILERRARVMTFDPVTLRPRNVSDENFIVYDAALLDGRLYAATADGVAWVTPDGTSGRVPNLSGAVNSIAADAARHRLLVALGRSAGTTLLSVTPAGRVTAAAGLDLTLGQVRVAAGSVWVAGVSLHGVASVEKLDPATLRRVLRLPDVSSLAPAATVLGVGTRDVFIGSDTELPVLWCVDAATGQRLDVLNVAPVSVVSTTGRTIAVIDRELLPLRPKAACSG